MVPGRGMYIMSAGGTGLAGITGILSSTAELNLGWEQQQAALRGWGPGSIIPVEQYVEDHRVVRNVQQELDGQLARRVAARGLHVIVDNLTPEKVLEIVTALEGVVDDDQLEVVEDDS
jgi:hypothetical protein